jgi:hypothetical protein
VSASANATNARERIGRAAADRIQVIVAAAIPAIADILAIPAISVIPAITDIPVTGMSWRLGWDCSLGAGCRSRPR